MEEKKTKGKSVFETLYAVNVNDKTEKKNGLTYLSWPFAWGEVKKAYPEATYKVYENENGWNYFTDGRSCWVKTSVTINGIECIEYLPVMDYRNASIPLERVTSMDVNKAIQRSLTKCCARHGLGLYIYAGEDLPEGDKAQAQPAPKNAPTAAPQAPQSTNKVVTEETVARWIAAAQSESDLGKAWAACPDTLKGKMQPKFAERKKELKGGAK